MRYEDNLRPSWASKIIKTPFLKGFFAFLVYECGFYRRFCVKREYERDINLRISKDCVIKVLALSGNSRKQRVTGAH